MSTLSSHARFLGGLGAVLANERDRSRTGPRVDGWASMQTNAMDLAMARGLALVDLAVGIEGSASTSPAPVDLARLPGRPIYRPLLAYALARTRQPVDLETARAHASPKSAVGVWWSLTAFALGDHTTTFDDLLLHQRPTGEFFDASPYDSPDLHWYDELVVLHALTTYAYLARRPEILLATDRAARFHTEETQPDHATSQPWAVHAFARSDQTLPLAELLLHGAMAQNAGRLDAISRILLADAVLCLKS